MSTIATALDGLPAPPLTLGNKFRQEVTYLATPAGVQDAPQALGPGEFWVRADDARNYLDVGAVTIISPLDSDFRTEIELTEDQERFLEWATRYAIQHVQLTSQG